VIPLGAQGWIPYCGAAPVPAELMGRWNFNPILLAGMALAGWWLWRQAQAPNHAAALLLAPGLSLFLFVLMAGGLAVAVGVARIVLAFRAADVLLGLLGAVTVLFGAVLLTRPGQGLLALVWIVAIEALVMGAILVALGFRLKRLVPGAATGR